MTTPGELVVGIHGQLLPGSAGGIETNLLSLLRSLDGLEESGRQVVIGPGDASEWLEAHLGARQSLLAWPPIKFSLVRRSGWLPPPVWELGKRALGSWRFGLARRLEALAGRLRLEHVTEGERITRTLIELGVQVVHFPYQRHFSTALPTIFEPWDLQHRHYPEFFTPQEVELREEIYRTGCRDAALVVTATAWSKRDLVRQFGLDPGKIAVIRRGAPAADRKRPAHDEAAAALRSFPLPERFVLYPAKPWPHKNHIRLFQALARLRERHGLTIPLVCTGRPIEGHWPNIQKSLEELSLDKTVVFTGHVSEEQMAALYRRAEFLVFSSLFEGLGIPLLEAMHFGLPIVTSTVTCLPEVAGDAALYFDPLSVESIAEAVHHAWTRPAMLEEYRAKGAARVRRFEWEVAVRQFLCCYRYVAGRRLGPEDQATLRSIRADGGP